MLFSFMTMALFVWMAVSYAQKFSYRPLWPIKTLRVLVAVALHGLLIPIVANLSSPFNCNTGAMWGSSKIQCYGTGHLGELRGDVGQWLAPRCPQS